MYDMKDPTLTNISSRRSQNKLTTRETEVLRLVAQGLTNKEISELLNITTGTVNVHVHHIICKLGVGNRTQATRWAIGKGLGSGESYDEGDNDNF
jgi:two-component system NarL family response regulator